MIILLLAHAINLQEVDGKDQQKNDYKRQKNTTFICARGTYVVKLSEAVRSRTDMYADVQTGLL